VKQLVDVVERGYLASLRAEEVVYSDLVASQAVKSSESAHLEGLPDFIRVAANEHTQMLKGKESNAKVLAEGLRRFGQGHKELAEKIDKLSLREAVKTARDYVDQIQQVRNLINQ
jgi:hypothetical protein